MEDQISIKKGFTDVEKVFSENDEKLWKGTMANISWSIKDPGADKNGQNKMKHALGEANLNWMGRFKDGFDETQDHAPVTRAVFHYFCAKDQLMVYNYGRSVLGYPPIK